MGVSQLVNYFFIDLFHVSRHLDQLEGSLFFGEKLHQSYWYFYLTLPLTYFGIKIIKFTFILGVPIKMFQ
jgi:hypothetical protein